MLRTRRDHLLATVLFTDIVGSSQIAAELGDRCWRVLLARHHLIVRKALKRHSGREIDNAGDGFFAAFDDQANAIRCACEISEAVHDLGIDIRAGLHVGQSEVVGKKLGGFAVNVGARVMAEAGPAEIFVSRVMRDLVAGSGFTFEERGFRTLKGIPGEWQIFAVTGVDGIVRQPSLEPVVAADLRGAIRPPPLLKPRTGRPLAVGIATALISVPILLFTTNDNEGGLHVVPNSLVRIDPVTSEMMAVVPITAPGAGQLTVVPDHPRARVPERRRRQQIWIASPDNQVISRVDANTNETLSPIGGYGGAQPGPFRAYGIVYRAPSVWVVGNDSTISKIDPSSRQVLTTVEIPGGPVLLAKGFGRIWVNVRDVGEVAAIDPRSADTVFEGMTGDVCSNGIAAGEGAVWVSNYCDDSVSRIDPQTGRSTTIPVGPGPAGIGIGFGSVWVTSVLNGTITRIDPETDRIEGIITIGEPSGTPASGSTPAAGYMWAASPSTNSIVRIDPVTNHVDGRIRLPYPPIRVIAAFGSIWATVVTNA